MDTSLAPTSTVNPTYSPLTEGTPFVALPPERYGTFARVAAGSASGIIAGSLLINSAQVAAGWAFTGGVPESWTTTIWGNHWAWRGVWSVAATFLAGFVAGMIARRRGALVGALVGAPSAMLWAVIALTGSMHHFPGLTAPADVPMGYRIVASLLALATVPVCVGGAEAGAPFGQANAVHFDGRRGTLLGVRWYHFLWLPFPMHIIAAQVTWASMYAFGWVVTSWKAGPSIFALVPTVFVVGMLATLQLSLTGAFRAYEALAGFEDDGPTPAATWKRVFKFGFGYPLAAGALQVAITAIHMGLARLLGH